jgi:hypothetical protein
MAIHHAIKQIVWHRQLMQGMGLQMFCKNPTLIHADNTQANNLCIDDIVTQGNMYFRTGYHYNKEFEAVDDGIVSIKYCLPPPGDVRDAARFEEDQTPPCGGGGRLARRAQALSRFGGGMIFGILGMSTSRGSRRSRTSRTSRPSKELRFSSLPKSNQFGVDIGSSFISFC